MGPGVSYVTKDNLMPAVRTFALASLTAAALIAGVSLAAAGGPEAPDRGAGASGRGDGSGMGQDNTESGKAKGPGDKPASPGAGEDKKAPSDGPVSPANCDDGSPPVAGSCQR